MEVLKKIIESIMARLEGLTDVVVMHEDQLRGLNARIAELEERAGKQVLRCERTGNPCGTDTWGGDYTCDCTACRDYLIRRVNGIICKHEWGEWIDARNKAVESGEMRLCKKCERAEIRAVSKHKVGRCDVPR